MTRLERYRDKLRRLEEKRNEMMRTGRYLQSNALNEDIKEVEQAIREAEEYEERCKMKPIRDMVGTETLHKMGIIPLMIECHLIADTLAAVAYMVVDACKEYGFSDVSLAPDLRELLDASNKFAGFLAKLSPELCDLLVRDETLVSAVHKKYVSYINQRLK